MPSQSDVAKRAKVSSMTVSRVINGQESVKEETREKVLEAIRELNYYPNEAARALNKNRSFGVGVFIPHSNFNFAAPYFLPLLVELERCFRHKGFHLVFDALEQVPGETADYTFLYHQRRVDGVVVIAPFEEKGQLKRLVEEQVPAVVLYGRPGNLPISYIDVDNMGGIRQLMEQLRSLGHKRVGFVMGEMSLPMARERLNGYLTGRTELGMEETQDLLFQGDWTPTSGASAFRHFSRLSHPPTAILCSNDHMALGVLQAAIRAGLSLPRDLTLGGFNNTDFTSFITPSLTTLGQPIESIAHNATELLTPAMDAKLHDLPAPSPAGKVLTPKPFWRNSFDEAPRPL